MADGLQSFNVPAQPAGLPPPGLQPTQFTAPANYQPVTAPQQFTGPTLPPPIDYTPQQQAPQGATTPDALPPGSHPPPFLAVLKNAETGLGRPLTPEEFDKFTNDYKTNFAVPALNAQFKGKKANVEAEIASFDNQVQHLRDQRYAAQTAAAAHSNGVGNFLGAAGTEAFNQVVPGTLAFSAKALGGVTSLGGLTPNAVSDALFKYGVDPNQIASGKTDQQAGQDFAKLIMGHNYSDPAFASLRAKLEAQGASKNSNVTGIGGAQKELSDYAYKANPYGAVTGDVAGLLAQALLTKKIGNLPEAAAGASRLAKFGLNVAEQAPLAEKITSQQATENQNRGDSTADVLKQYGVDLPANLAFMGMPGSVASGSKIVRALTGAGIGTAQTLAQQNLDAAVNPSNKPENPLTSPLGITQIGLQAAMAVLLGGKGNVLKAKTGEPTPEATASTETPPQGAGEGEATAGAATPAGDTARPAAAPLDMYKAMLDTAPADGIEQPAFIKLQATALEKANAQSKKYKTEIQNANTPEKVVNGAMALAQRFTGKQWDTLNADQRSQTVETLAAWLGKKSKVDMDSIDAHLETLRNPQVPDTGTPPIAEQPLPADIQGQQVPGTAAQDALDGQKPLPATETPAYTPNQKYDSVWQQVTDENVPTESLPPDGQLLRGALDAGKITSREQFDNLLDTAAANKAKGNKLKAATAAKVVAKPIVPSPDTAKKAVADTVTEALTDNSTPADQRNKLKSAVKQQTEKQYNQSYLKALANRDNAPADAGEAQIRQDPAFNAAAEAMRQGTITSADDVGRFLKEQKGTNTVGDALAGHETKQIGALLGSKSTKSEIVQARKAVRDNLVEPLTKLGEDPDAVKKMTVAQAMTHLQKLANTFNSGEEKAPVKKGLAKGRANIEPVENPDETPPTKPKGNKLKKTNIEPVEKPAKPTLKGKPKSPKAQAPANEAGATPLESQLRERFGDTLPLKRLDALHDAISEARMGDDTNLHAEIAGLADDNLSKEDIKWIKSAAKEQPLEDIQNNASGESSASLEAQHRLADEKTNGQTRAIIRRDGSVEPMHGVDAVDTHARAGEVVVQRGVGKDDWTVLSHGDDLSRDVATGKVNRAREELNNVHDEVQKPTFDEAEALNDSARKEAAKADLAPERIAPVQVKRRVGKIIDEVREGADVHDTGKKLQALHDDMEKSTLERKLRDAVRPERRGVEYVRSRLQKMVADNAEGSDHYEAGKFGLWLLEKNPNLANYLALRIRSIGKDGEGAAGQFIPSERLVSINSKNTNPGTAVHEILHSAEQLMPPELQDNLRGEYIGRLQNKYKQVVKSGNKVAQRYIQLAIESYAHPSAEAQKEMSLLMRTQQKDIPYDEYYKYSNPSEYFAVEGTKILGGRYEAGSVRARIQQWMKEFVEHVKSFLGMDSNSGVIKAINETLKSKGEDYNPKMLASKRKSFNDERIDDEQAGDEPTDKELGYETAEGSDLDPNMEALPPKKKDALNLSKVTTAQHAVEQSMKASYGVEKAMQKLRAEGVKITEHNNVEDAIYGKNGLTSEYNSKDFDEAFTPVDNLVSQIYTDHAKTKQEFIDKLNKFYQNTHFIERAKTDWAMESPLEGTAGFDRADLLEKVSEGTIDPVKAAKELDTLVRKHASTTWEEWAETNKVPLESMQKELVKLDKESNINTKSMAKLNGLMDAARTRTTERLENAGLVDKADPWKAFYGWKWYVPLKGSAYGGGPDNNFDLIPSKRIALSRLNQQMHVMDGRHSFAERPFSRLFVDMARAGERQANSSVLDTVYNLAVDHGKNIGAHIDTFTGRPKDGYTNTKTGEQVDRLKAPASGIIVNDGDTHYVITLPKDSQLLRGLVQMNNVERPNALERKVAKGTNVLARLYTTVHPGWQTFSGFIRDLTYIPITDAATRFSNPLEAIPTWTRYAGNVAQAYKALPTLLPHLLGDSSKLRAMGEADPNSWAGWTRRYEAAGGSNNFTKGFDVPGTEKLLQSRLKDIDGVLDATSWGWAKTLEYTGNYANFLESIGRVAMFKTKVEMGSSERQAAIDVRKLLDYSESGIKGRRINSWLAFFRVGMTGADAMRRAFTKPTGGFDFKKMAAWQAFMGALGAMGYMAGTAMLGQDPDGKDRISKVDPSILTQKMLFPLGDKVAGVNMGLGLPQVLMAPGILAAAVSAGHVKPEKALQVYMDTLARNGPITPAGTKGSTPTDFLASYALGFTPTVIRPLVDVERNTTTFNSSIHSETSSGKYASDSGRTNTPEVFKDMARWLADATDHKVDYAPEDLRYLIQSYGGQWATDFVKEAISNPDVAAGAPPEPNRMAGKLLVDTSHYMQNEMYDTLDQLQDSRRRYNSIVSRAKDDGASDAQAKAQADQIVSRDPQFKTELLAYRALDNARKAYQQKVNELRNNKLMSDTRKQLIRKQLDTQMRMAIEKAQTGIKTD